MIVCFNYKINLKKHFKFVSQKWIDSLDTLTSIKVYIIVKHSPITFNPKRTNPFGGKFVFLY